MFRPVVPARDDLIIFDLLRTVRGVREPEKVGTATFIAGRVTVEAPENIKVAIEEELERPFVDRVQADERPAGYRRSGKAAVDFLVPGMPEHFRARMRGLWLSYPDGSVVTARTSEYQPPIPRMAVRRASPEPVVSDPVLRAQTLDTTERALVRPLVRGHPPAPGVRPEDELPPPVGRTDCGWLC